jgi:murein DD-endopeptidase MepM/ murein hydrolase activator NlpD
VVSSRQARRSGAAEFVSTLLASLALAAAILVAVGPTSCASPSPPRTSEANTATHIVAAGENLYRIGLRYGVSPDELARANRIGDVTQLAVGTRLTVPNPRRNAGRSASTRKKDIASAKHLARVEARRRANLEFQWPLRGRLTSGFGPRGGRRHEGIDVAARRGTEIDAAEDGRVIHSGRLGDYGKVVIVRHDGDYRSVYAHAHRTHVKKGQKVEKGQKIAEVGSTGRSTGPHLHFEIRQRQTPQDPMLYLP